MRGGRICGYWEGKEWHCGIGVVVVDADEIREAKKNLFGVRLNASLAESAAISALRKLQFF